MYLDNAMHPTSVCLAEGYSQWFVHFAAMASFDWLIASSGLVFSDAFIFLTTEEHFRLNGLCHLLMCLIMAEAGLVCSS